MIEIEVKGKPKAWANNEKGEEVKWREMIRDKIRKDLEEGKYTKIKKNTKLKIEVIFYLNGKRIDNSDLDNLAKPVMDTICQIRQSHFKDKSLIGNLSEDDDGKVFELILKKEERETEGALIRVWELS